jgi:hypothetical protein
MSSAPTVCPSCSGDRIAVLPEASFEGFWKTRQGGSASNGFIRASVHLCTSCGLVRLYALNPDAQLRELGATVELLQAAPRA